LPPGHPELLHPAGYGSSSGLNFILNSFEPFTQRYSKKFLLAVTNENNPFDIFKQNYVLEPGHVYKFRVIANQIVTTEKFDQVFIRSRIRYVSLKDHLFVITLTE